jgi:hypothetical protein
MARVWQDYPRLSCSILATRWQVMDRHDEWRVEQRLSAKPQRRGHQKSERQADTLRVSAVVNGEWRYFSCPERMNMLWVEPA